jgi:hypothetical protein
MQYYLLPKYCFLAHVWLVADFEALSYQVTTTFDTSYAARIRTAPAINYTACYRLVFFVFRYFSFIFAASFLTAVCLGRQALLQVLVLALACATSQCA